MKKILFTFALITGCGTEQTSNLDIVNGQRVYRSWYGKVGGCGSTLIAPRWAISARHCFGSGHPKHVTFGLYRKGDPKNGGKPMDKVPVKRVIKHPSWDLALIELTRRSKIKPIAMTTETPYNQDKLQAFGFGNTEYGGSSPEYLQGAVFKYNRRATEKARPGIIRAENRTKHAVCHGDSGGPLVYRGKLIATITFTEGKCSINGLMGFTKLDMSWIKRHVK